MHYWGVCYRVGWSCKKNAVLYNKIFCTDFSACRIAIKGIFLLPRCRVCVHKVEYWYQTCCSWVAVYNIHVCVRVHVCEVAWQCVFFIYIFIHIYIKMYKTYMLYFHKLGISLVTWSGNCSRSSSLMNESIMYPTAHDVWFIYAVPEGSLEPQLSLSSIPAAVLWEWLLPRLWA